MMTVRRTKTAVVTGAFREVSAAEAKRLSTDGFAVVVNYSGSETDAAEVVSAIGWQHD